MEREKQLVHETNLSKQGPSLKQWRMVLKFACEKGSGLPYNFLAAAKSDRINLERGLKIEKRSGFARILRNYIIKF